MKPVSNFLDVDNLSRQPVSPVRTPMPKTKRPRAESFATLTENIDTSWTDSSFIKVSDLSKQTSVGEAHALPGQPMDGETPTSKSIYTFLLLL